MQPRIVVEILPFPPLPPFLSLVLPASSFAELLGLIAEHPSLPTHEFVLDFS
jgi:hypothetical protein